MMERAIIEYIVNALWQIPFLAAGAWCLLQITRPKPQVRHGIWLAALGLAVVMPMHGIARTGLTRPQAESASRIAAVQLNESREAALPKASGVRIGETTTHWLVGLYLATVILGLCRIGHSWISSRRLVERSREVFFEGQTQLDFEDCGRRFGIRLPQIRESAEVSSPMILGAAKSILLLPESFTRYTAEQIRAAVCHELAHVRRRDYVSNLICQLAALPVVWHPVVSAMQQQVRLSRELVCDAIAARVMETRIGYARCLLTLARSMNVGPELAEQAQFFGLFGSNSLEERVMRLMDTTTMSLRVRVARVAGGVVVAILTASVAATFHVIPTMAEVRVQAPAEAVQSAPAPSESQPTLPAVASPQATGKSDSSESRAEANQVRRKAEIKRQAEAEEMRKQDAKAQAMRESPEFKRALEDAREQGEKVKAMLNTPEFKQQIEDAQKQAIRAQAVINSPEFKRQMEEAQKAAVRAQAMIDSPEFKRQMENAQKAAARAKEMMDSPEIKRQIEDEQKAAARAGELMNSPEFKKQMEEVKKSAEAAADAAQKLVDESERSH